jgi:hypothetical protein
MTTRVEAELTRLEFDFLDTLTARPGVVFTPEAAGAGLGSGLVRRRLLNEGLGHPQRRLAGDVSGRTVRSCAESSISVASRLRLVSSRFALRTQ